MAIFSVDLHGEQAIAHLIRISTVFNSIVRPRQRGDGYLVNQGFS